MAVRRLDSHVHVWDWQLETYDWMTDEMAAIRRPFTIDDLRPHLHDHSVTGAVLVQTCPSLDETRQFLALADEHPEIVGVVGWVDLTDRGVDDVVRELREGPGGRWLVGVRHQVHDEADPNWLDRDDVRRGIAALGRHGLVYDVLVRTRELPAAVRLVEDLTDQRFVIDHIAKPPIASGERGPWATRMRQFAGAPHVACKFSGMVTEADWTSWTVSDLKPYADVVLEVFGPGRVLFGSDWPVCTVAASYPQVVRAADELLADLDDHARDRVSYRTAVETYGLHVGVGS